MADPNHMDGPLDDGSPSLNGRRHKQAVALVILSAAVISTSGILIRSLEAATEWQVVFWRGVSLAVGVFVVLFIQHRGATINTIRSIGWLGVLGSMFFGGAMIGYVLAITNTTVANAVFTMSAVPFFTAVLAWVLLGERVSAITAVAIAAACVGIALMVGDGIATGTVFGNAMALFAAVCIAFFVVILRKGRAVNMLPATAIGGLLSAVLAFYFMEGGYQVSRRDLVICLTLGGIISCMGHVFFVIASRRLSNAELTLLTLIEFILGPIWVWMFINEVPNDLSLIGGAVVLSAVGGHALFSMVKQGQP